MEEIMRLNRLNDKLESTLKDNTNLVIYEQIQKML